MTKRFLYVGNRFYVLQAMLEAGLSVSGILAAADSYLEKELKLRGIAHHVFHSKAELNHFIHGASFDILISSGCPYILRVSELKQPGQQFINIHPSLLPDLRGKHPINGAILHAHDGGATCHVMDDGIDSGDIISQVRIPYHEELDARQLYALSFAAEVDAFKLALARDFAPLCTQVLAAEHIRYARKPDDLRIDFTEPAELIKRRVKAFNDEHLGAFFMVGDEVIRVFDAQCQDDVSTVAIATVQRVDDTGIWVKAGRGFILLKSLVGNVSAITVGMILS